MACCLESAFQTRLGTIDGIAADQVFINVRKCDDCLPYAVVKVEDNGGRATSSFIPLVSTVRVEAYFQEEADALDYKAAVTAWLQSGKCLNLADCGCLCLNEIRTSKVDAVPNRLHRYSVLIRGRWQPSASSSV